MRTYSASVSLIMQCVSSLFFPSWVCELRASRGSDCQSELRRRGVCVFERGQLPSQHPWSLFDPVLQCPVTQAHVDNGADSSVFICLGTGLSCTTSFLKLSLLNAELLASCPLSEMERMCLNPPWNALSRTCQHVRLHSGHAVSFNPSPLWPDSPPCWACVRPYCTDSVVCAGAFLTQPGLQQ